MQKPLTPDSRLLTPDSKGAREPPEEVEALPTGVLPNVWRDWKRHRGKKLSREAIRRQTDRLAELQVMGHEPNAVILQSIERGWSGLFELKRATGPPVSLAERRAANIAGLTGQVNRERAIDGTAERMDREAVPALPGDLRKPRAADVG